jgi:hypothetical protein
MEKIRMLGRTVLYFERNQGDPRPAVITAVHNAPPLLVDLTVFRPGSSPMQRERVPQAPTDADKALAALADENAPSLQDKWCWHPDDTLRERASRDE